MRLIVFLLNKCTTYRGRAEDAIASSDITKAPLLSIERNVILRSRDSLIRDLEEVPTTIAISAEVTSGT